MGWMCRAATRVAWLQGLAEVEFRLGGGRGGGGADGGDGGGGEGGGGVVGG